MDISTTVAKTVIGLVLLNPTMFLLLPGDSSAQTTGLRDKTKNTSASDKEYVPNGKVLKGTVSWYGGRFHGRRTAYGERFNRNAMTLASRHLPHNTRVRVTNLRTGRSAIGRVNDYGPRHKNRIADLSEGMAEAIGAKRSGTAPVRIEVLRRK
jgi:rare lipoprotein A